MVRLVFFGVVATLLFLIVREAYLFRIVFWDGQATQQRRTIPGTVRTALAELAKERKLTGTVTLYPAGYLHCSRTIAEPDRQRLRDALARASQR